MTDRYNVHTSTILGTNYKVINITVDNTNPQIDEEVTVTVNVKDVYGDPLTNTPISVDCTGGTFTQVNGSTITPADNITANTNSSGNITITYTCSDWGANIISTDTANVIVYVTGYKQVKSYSSGFYTLSIDGSSRTARLSLNATGQTFNTGEQYAQEGWIPSEYLPHTNMYTVVGRQQNLSFYGTSEGNVACYNNGSSGTITSSASIYYNY